MSVTRYEVVLARQLMRDGRSAREAAERLGVMFSALDAALWNFIDLSDSDLDPPRAGLPQPMF